MSHKLKSKDSDFTVQLKTIKIHSQVRHGISSCTFEPLSSVTVVSLTAVMLSRHLLISEQLNADIFMWRNHCFLLQRHCDVKQKRCWCVRGCCMTTIIFFQEWRRAQIADQRFGHMPACRQIEDLQDIKSASCTAEAARNKPCVYMAFYMCIDEKHLARQLCN